TLRSKCVGRKIDDRCSRDAFQESDPPHISVAHARPELGGRLRIGLRALTNPGARNNLAAVPRSLVEIEQRKPREVARAHANRVGRMLGSRAPEVLAVAWLIVLHPDGPGDALLERGKDRFSRGSLVDRPQRIEVPVVVVPEGAGRMAATRGAALCHAAAFIE